MLPGDVELFETVRQPVMINRNAYLNGAQPFNQEQERLMLAGEQVTGKLLGKVRIVDAAFENPDGSPVDLSSDYFGQPSVGVGPIAGLCSGQNCFLVWKGGDEDDE